MKSSNKKTARVLSLLILFTFTLGGCSQSNIKENTGITNTENTTNNSVDSADSNNVATNDSTNINNEIIPSEYFSDRDFNITYDENNSALITLEGDSASCSSNAVAISGTTITIAEEGTYILTGTLNDGMVIINSEKTDKIQLVLNGVNLNSETSAAIYVKQADKVFITTAPDTINTLSNGGTFTAIDTNNIDAALFSKEDLTLNGTGTLVVTSPIGHGIVSKDSLTITGGNYDINCAAKGLSGKDDICIADGSFTIVSGKDGIHAENTDDASLGFVYIQGGSFTLTTQGDGISAASNLIITDGTFRITSGGGSENASSHTSSSWGNFMGGGRPQGERGGDSRGGASTETSDDDSTSIKGIKATADLLINGGSFLINSADDSIHSNTSITVNGGNFEIAAGDDAFHADDTLTITNGFILIKESYEGLEGLHVKVTGGEISLTASDDGINAAGGTDSSGLGGRDAMFGHGSYSSNGSIVISGGTVDITASGDGIDANGTLNITEGFVTVCGPTQGDTATLDYDTEATISGGTFIGTGSSSMAQTFSDATQGVIAIIAGKQAAGTVITLSDADGNVIITHSPELDFSVVILSSPKIVSKETYLLTVGTLSSEVTAN